METQTNKTSVRDYFLRTIAVLGLIAILLLGAWGIIQLAFALPNVFGNIGNSFTSLFTHNTAPASTKEDVAVSVPATTPNGQPVTVSWVHANADKSGQYSYALSYACESGLSVKAPLPNGSYQSVPCNTLFNYVNASGRMTLVPSVSGASQLLAVTVTATKLATGAVSASGNATTNVTAKAATAPAATTPPAPAHTKPSTSYTKPSTTYYPAARPASLYGYGDLAVRITSVSPSYSNTVIKFVIENIGTNSIPAGWTFNANLPINGSLPADGRGQGYTFGSQPQQALYPGDKIAYTLSFAGTNQANQYQYDQYGYQGGYGYASSGYNCNGYVCNNNNYVSNGYPAYNYGYQTAVITITADPQNYVPEYNKGNNTAQTTIPLY